MGALPTSQATPIVGGDCPDSEMVCCLGRAYLALFLSTQVSTSRIKSLLLDGLGNHS